MTRGRARRYLLVKQGYYPQVVADAGYTVFDWSTLNAGTLFQDSAKTTPASANGDVVGCWTDGVGGVDATQVTTANKPGLATASLNGLPTLSFDGGDVLGTANITVGTFAVWIVANVTAGQKLYQHGSNPLTSNGMWLNRLITQRIVVYRSSSISKNSSDAFPSSWVIDRIEHNGTYASLREYNNNIEVSLSAGVSGDLGSLSATQPFYIGARAGGADAITGNIGQVLIMSPYPTDANILTNMESYINGLWGVY